MKKAGSLKDWCQKHVGTLATTLPIGYMSEAGNYRNWVNLVNSTTTNGRHRVLNSHQFINDYF